MKLFPKIAFVLSLCCFLFVGCDKDDDDNPVTVEQNSNVLPTYVPTGTITGLIRDYCTNAAIKGAVLSLSYNGSVTSVVSDDAGQFSFDNVPAGQYKVTSGGVVATGTYTVTASLVEYNKSVSDTTTRYRNYYYDTVTIAFTSLVPGDSLGVQGLVGSIIFDISQLNTTITGQVVDEKMQPVQSALVALVDLSITPGVILQQTRTDANGNYTFQAVDNGITVNIAARSSDGKYEGILPTPLSIPCNLYNQPLRSQVTAERVQLQWAYDVAPYVIDISPINNADVSPTNLAIVYTFSAPIKQTPYTRTDLGEGHGTILDDITVSYLGMKKSAGAVTKTVAWNSTMTQLTITPSGIVGSAKYSITVSGALPKLQNEAGLAVVNNMNIIGDFETLNLTTAGGSTLPGAPILSRRLVTNVYSKLDFNGGVVSLEWNSDANARSYNLYRKIGDGSFELIHKNVYSLIDTNAIGSLVSPAANNPLKALNVQYQVRAVSKDLVEGPASNIITVVDEVQPLLVSTTSSNIGTLQYRFVLRFSEPLVISSAENINNYTIQNPDTVVFTKQEAAYLGFNAGNYEVALVVSISNGNNLPAGFSILVGNNIVDLAGNIIDPANNVYVYSTPPTPSLRNPADGAVNVPTSSALEWNSANGAVTYRLQISTTATFATTVFDKDKITSTSYSLSGVTGLTSGATYYWRVQAINSVGSSAFSATRSFTLQ